METSLTNELIREVYPIDAHEECYVNIHKETGRVMWFGKELNDCRSEIDKHNVANKCKEWIIKKGYKKVYSGIYESTDQGNLYICIIHSKEENDILDFWKDNEPDAIFEACDWIRNKLKG